MAGALASAATAKPSQGSQHEAYFKGMSVVI